MHDDFPDSYTYHVAAELQGSDAIVSDAAKSNASLDATDALVDDSA